MKLTTIFLILSTFASYGQTDTVKVPLPIARLIIRDLTQKDLEDSLITIQTKHMINLSHEVTLQDSVIKIHEVKEVLYDSIIRNKDGIIGSQATIIKAKSNRFRVPWWTLLIAAGVAWAIHP